ncbi:MAG: hypothetical protein HC802_04340 [Caldilineaceae bacterium]|nr:hypothetical protein [Caldilineaceae bacterium]
MTRAFSMIDIPTRPVKPRQMGLTMMIDWGIPLTAQQDTLALAGDFIDLAKIAVGISGLLSEEMLRAKLDAYRAAGVEPFPGGMYVELAHKQGKTDAYFAECKRVGYSLVEISDNVVHFSPETRSRLIRQAVEDHGLRVLGEVGSKHVETDPATLVADIKGSLEAGAWKVFVEAAEFVVKGGFDTGLVEYILSEVDASDILFELPGHWIADVHAHEIYRMMMWLVEHVGIDVNIGNVASSEVIPLETLRTHVGVNMKL